TLHSLNMLHARGFLAAIFTILAKHQIAVDLVTTSEVNVALTIDTTGTNTDGSSLITDQLIQELSTLCRVHIENDLALVAIIGNQLPQSKELNTAIFSTLNDTVIRMVCFGASHHNVCLLVAEQDAEQVVQQLHHALFKQT